MDVDSVDDLTAVEEILPHFIIGFAYYSEGDYSKSNHYFNQIKLHYQALESSRYGSNLSHLLLYNRVYNKAVNFIKVIDKTANWQAYRNEEVGFEFQYPKGEKTTFTNKNVDFDINLYILVKKMPKVIDEPMRFSRDYLLEERNALINNDDLFFSNLKYFNFPTVIKNNFGILGTKYMILAQIEVCDIQFVREANIYIDDYYINLRWYCKNIDEIVDNNLNYFIPGEVGCNDNNKMWDFENNGIENFYNDSVIGKTDFVSQKWFNDFETILSTFKFIEKDKMKILSPQKGEV